MCDYSTMNVPNRLAVEGEELAAHRFQNGSIGLLSGRDLDHWLTANVTRSTDFWSWLKSIGKIPADPAPVVCVPPGACLYLFEIPIRLRKQYRLNCDECVTFTQLSADPGRHRDAIVCGNGLVILLQEFEEGQRLRVLRADPGKITNEYSRKASSPVAA